MKQSVRTSAVTLLLTLGLCPDASAQSAVAVLGVDVGDGPANRASCLSQQLKSQVKGRSGYALTASKDLDEIKLVFGCINEEPACLAKAGASLQAEKLLWGTLRRARGGYSLTLRLLDVAQAKLEQSATALVSPTQLRSGCAARTVERLAAKLLVNRFGKLVITADVSGAEVLMGRTVIGVLEGKPIVLADLPPGTYRIQITKEGLPSHVEEVKVTAGRESRVEARLDQPAAPVVGSSPILEPVPPPEEPSGSGVSGWKVAFWTSAVATLGMAAGIGVSGYTVIKTDKDKDALINEFRDAENGKNRRTLPPESDVCSDPALSGEYKARMDDLCGRGDTHALLTNVFIGLTVAAAAASGFFYYKAYVSSPTEERPVARGKGREGGVRWTLAPAAAPDGGGLGFHLQF